MRKPWSSTFVKIAGKRVCKIPLSQGLFALIDVEFLAVVQQYSWSAYRHSHTYYAGTKARSADGARRTLYLHGLIWLLLSNTGQADHKNNNGLDCRARNLRPGPQNLNRANSRKTAHKSSRYKGVSWNKNAGKWEVRIKVANNSKYLGCFSEAEEKSAAFAYDRAALKAWGKYANLNFPRRN